MLLGEQFALGDAQFLDFKNLSPRKKTITNRSLEAHFFSGTTRERMQKAKKKEIEGIQRTNRLDRRPEEKTMFCGKGH